MGSAASKRVEPLHTGLNGDCPRVGAEDKFSIVDEHARKAPTSLMTSDQDLVTYFCRESKDDVNKIRAIYIWIISNRRHLEKLAKNERKQGQILAEKFNSLTKIVGIQSKVITGLHKAPSNQSDSGPTVCGNHCWNVVHLAGNWHVVDCLCGASDVSVESFYFLPDPEQFINNHFPLDLDQSWQLIRNPISLEEFNQAPLISEIAMVRGVSLLSPKSRIINVHQSMDCTIKDPRTVLTDIAVVLSSEDGLIHNEFIFISRTDVNTYVINATPPFAGNFRLTVQGKLSTTRIETITELVLLCVSVKKRVKKFPKDYETWGIEPKFPEIVQDLCDVPRTFQEVKDGRLDCSIATRTKLEVYASLKWLGDGRTLDDHVGTESTPSRIRLKSVLPKKGFYRVCLFLRRTELLYPVLYLLVYNKKEVSKDTPRLGYSNMEVLV